MRGRKKRFVRIKQQHERLIASKRTNITVLRARLMRQRVHTFVTHSHHRVARPREIVLSQCVPGANYKRDTLAIHTRRSISVSPFGRNRIT